MLSEDTHAFNPSVTYLDGLLWISLRNLSCAAESLIPGAGPCTGFGNVPDPGAVGLGMVPGPGACTGLGIVPGPRAVRGC